MAWTNADGIVVRFGSDYRNKPANFTRAVPGDNVVKELIFDFDLTKIPDGTVSYPFDLNNDGTVDGFTKEVPFLPANSVVLSTDLFVTEAAAGGTAIAFGTFLENGTAIDADGLITAAVGVVANLNAVGKRVHGVGAQVALSSNAGASIGTANAFLGLTATGTFTAGKGQILVRYVQIT